MAVVLLFWPRRRASDRCPGYKVVGDRRERGDGFSVDLKLAGSACDLYGTDLDALVLDVHYETAQRLRVHIRDANASQFQIPEIYLPRPSSVGVAPGESELLFHMTERPFGFAVSRKSDGDVLFDTRTRGLPSLVFEDSFLRVATKLPHDANLYGLGEVAASSGFRRDPRATTQAIFNRDPGGTPEDSNLYGAVRRSGVFERPDFAASRLPRASPRRQGLGLARRLPRQLASDGRAPARRQPRVSDHRRNARLPLLQRAVAAGCDPPIRYVPASLTVR